MTQNENVLKDGAEARLRPLENIEPDQPGDVFALVRMKDKTKVGERWVTMFQQSLEKMAQAKEMTLEMYRVRDKLLSMLDFDNWVFASQSAIARDLGMKQPNVSRAIKGLVDIGFLVIGPKRGTANTYRLNPEYAWKGSLEYWQGARARFRREFSVVSNPHPPTSIQPGT